MRVLKWIDEVIFVLLALIVCVVWGLFCYCTLGGVPYFKKGV